MPEFTVRPISEADYDDVIAMLTKIAALHHNGRPDIFYGSGSKYRHEDLAALVSTAGYYIFILDTPDIPSAGYLFCQVRDTEAHGVCRPNRVLWVDDLFVKDEARRDGVGSALLAHAQTFAAKQQCDRVELNVWAFNESAIAFYKKNGLNVQRCIMEIPL